MRESAWAWDDGSSTHRFNSLNKSLVSAHHVAGSVLGTRGTSVSKTDQDRGLSGSSHPSGREEETDNK